MEPLESTEQRREPRYRRLLPVRIGSLELATANVSLHGLQVVCPVMRFQRIKADIRRGELAAEVSVPGGAPLAAALAVRYCSQAGDEVLIGVQLNFAAPDMQARWAAYIEDLSVGLRNGPKPRAAVFV